MVVRAVTKKQARRLSPDTRVILFRYTGRAGGGVAFMIVKCPCGEDHQVPVSLEKSITDWDEKITIVFGRRGSWRTTKGFLYFHGAEYDDFPELAERYGFERVADTQRKYAR